MDAPRACAKGSDAIANSLEQFAVSKVKWINGNIFLKI
jgi:hypothetical protein